MNFSNTFSVTVHSHFSQGTRESALEDCTSAIELNPNYVKALSRRGQLYEDLDKPHEAMKDFNRVLDMDKNHAEANKAAMVSVM